MLSTDDVRPLFRTLQSLVHQKADESLRRALANGTPELIETQYDNWNGGTRYYTLAIRVPIAAYAAIENRLESIEESLAASVEKLQRSATHDFITKVVIEPSGEPAGVSVAEESRFWIPGHFRLFISHLSAKKVAAANLKNALHKFGISSFVAHEDIEPTREWQREIELALFTMDALAAIYTEGFRDSNWTDQEVGVAIGRGVVLVPIRNGIDPYGLAGKIQGIQGHGRSVGEVAHAVFDTLLRNERTSHRLISCLTEQMVLSPTPQDAISRVSLLNSAPTVPSEHLKRIVQNIQSLPVAARTQEVLDAVNGFLQKHGEKHVAFAPDNVGATFDDVPF